MVMSYDDDIEDIQSLYNLHVPSSRFANIDWRSSGDYLSPCLLSPAADSFRKRFVVSWARGSSYTCSRTVRGDGEYFSDRTMHEYPAELLIGPFSPRIANLRQ